MSEGAFVRLLAERYEEAGYEVIREEVRNGGRADLSLRRDGELNAIVEAKVAAPIAGIGQLFRYAAELDPSPRLVLAVPTLLSSDSLRAACSCAGVELDDATAYQDATALMALSGDTFESVCADAAAMLLQIGSGCDRAAQAFIDRDVQAGTAFLAFVTELETQFARSVRDRIRAVEKALAA
jgi:hypothetical protein